MSTGWRFFVGFFCIHFIASVAYYFLAGQSGSMGPGGGHVGVPIFGGMLFLLSGGQPMADSGISLLLLPFNSAITAGLATGIFQVVRRLKAA